MMLGCLWTMTACAGARSNEAGSADERKKSETDKNEPWDLAMTLEREKAACQRRLAEQAASIDRLSSRLSDQQSATDRSNQQILALNRTIEEQNRRWHDLRQAGHGNLLSGAPPATPAASWGALMRVQGKTNIRMKRSRKSKILGYLLPGQTVKADFLEDDWYAVFNPAETVRSEKKALGYVHAPRLFRLP
ncbi:MAG: SH3 domain-containing protein, partial [Thermodesulfobacteriota bacterium]